MHRVKCMLVARDYCVRVIWLQQFTLFIQVSQWLQVNVRLSQSILLFQDKQSTVS